MGNNQATGTRGVVWEHKSERCRMPLFELKLRNDEEVKRFKELYQTTKVQEPEGDSLFDDCTYVLYTIHEREIK